MRYLEIEMGGQVRKMSFDAGMLIAIEEITGKPYSEYQFDSSNMRGLVPGLSTIVHAAMLSYNEDQQIDAAEIPAWLKRLSLGELSVIADYYMSSFKLPSVAGEGVNNTQAKAALS